MTKKINWAGVYDLREGYGYHFTKQLMAIDDISHEHDISVIPLLKDQLYFTPRMARMSGIDLTNPLLYVGQPTWERFSEYPGRVMLNTMFETDQIPKNWVGIINQYVSLVVTPSPFCTEIFEKCGVTVPVITIEPGLDQHEYYLLPEPDYNKEIYTFMALGDRGERKGHDIAWEAFYKAFQDNPNVRLIIKSRAFNMKYFKDSLSDKRIHFWRYDAPHMNQVYPFADCFVFPTRGEGSGFPPREATSMGIPAIATEWSGTRDVSNWGIPITEYDLVESRYGGNWVRPSVDQLAETMLWVYNNRKEAREVAVNGHNWLKENWTWEAAAQKYIDIFKELS